MKTVALALLLVGAVVGRAQADTLITPPLLGDPGAVALCAGINVDAVPRDVTVTLFNDQGAPLGTKTCIALASGHSCQTSASPGVQLVYCNVAVSARKAARLSLMIVDSSGVVTAAIGARRED